MHHQQSHQYWRNWEPTVSPSRVDAESQSKPAMSSSSAMASTTRDQSATAENVRSMVEHAANRIESAAADLASSSSDSLSNHRQKALQSATIGTSLVQGASEPNQNLGLGAVWLAVVLILTLVRLLSERRISKRKEKPMNTVQKQNTNSTTNIPRSSGSTCSKRSGRRELGSLRPRWPP